MKGIGIAMYILTFIYFAMMFILPTMFIEEECGSGIPYWVFILYLAQAVLTGAYEVWAVLRI